MKGAKPLPATSADTVTGRCMLLPQRQEVLTYQAPKERRAARGSYPLLDGRGPLREARWTIRGKLPGYAGKDAQERCQPWRLLRGNKLGQKGPRGPNAKDRSAQP